MNAPLKSMLLVLGAVSLGGLVLKNAHAGLSTLGPSGEESSSSVDLADKKEGGVVELGHKDGGSIELANKGEGGWVTLADKKDAGAVELANKGEGGWVTLADKKDAGVVLELAGKGDGGGWITLAH